LALAVDWSGGSGAIPLVDLVMAARKICASWDVMTPGPGEGCEDMSGIAFVRGVIRFSILIHHDVC
jgi:hypothetical protein